MRPVGRKSRFAGERLYVRRGSRRRAAERVPAVIAGRPARRSAARSSLCAWTRRRMAVLRGGPPADRRCWAERRRRATASRSATG